MQFVFQPLAWGFLLVLVPLLIHLINLVRHRRTQWAAMEFLLESNRKHRRWVWLKQVLLIASRMLAMAVLVAMLAQWVSGTKWLAALGQSTTHHYVVLDDSASMGDLFNGRSAYQNALGGIQAIANAATQSSGSHLLSVFRTSRATLATGNNSPPVNKSDDRSKTNEPRADAIADLLSRTIPSDPTALLATIQGTTPSSMDTPLNESLRTLVPLLKQNESEQAIVYLMSDFRSKDWTNVAVLKQSLQAMVGETVQIQLIDCVDSRHENLSITSIAPRQEVLAAGVPTMVNVTVRNNGVSSARNITARVTAVDYSITDGDPKPTQKYSGIVTELPPLLFDRIEPGESVTRNVQVLFPKAGSHVIEAELPPDALVSDNNMRCVLDIVEGLRVLLVDGDPAGKHSFFFESALNPGGNAKTGLLITRESPEFLRDTDPSALDNYACIIVQSVPSLDVRSLENLHRYVSQGGGLSVWFGDNVTMTDYLQGYAAWAKPIAGAKDATPLLPFTLKGVAELTKTAGDPSPDIIADNHPIFAPLLGLINSPFQFVRVQRYVEIETSKEDKRATWKPVASLRNGQPLLIDHPIGSGRVLVGLTSLDRRWSNWPQDPSFVVAALKLVGYLSSFRTTEIAKPTGSSLRWDFSSQEMLPETQLLCPAQAGNNIRSVIEVNATPIGDHALQAVLEPSSAQITEDTIRVLTSSGNFEWWGTAIQGNRVIKNLARNTPPVEGELERVTQADLSRSLSGVKFTYRSADGLGSNLVLSGLANRNMLLMAFLLLLLVAEQWLAWSASYHLPKR